MKIRYNEFIEACTDINHQWVSEYSTEFFKCFFGWVDYVENGLRFGTIINKYANGKFEWERNKNHKDTILIYFTIYENGNFNIKTEIRGWSVRNKKIQIENVDKLLDINCKYIDELYKNIYNKNLFY